METERRVENLLSSSKGALPAHDSVGGLSQSGEQSIPTETTKSSSILEDDAAKEKYSIELRDRHQKMKVCLPTWLLSITVNLFICTM